MTALTREYLARIVAQEAKAEYVRPEQVTSCGTGGGALARGRVWRRAMRETGCSALDLVPHFAGFGSDEIANHAASLGGKDHTKSAAARRHFANCVAWRRGDDISEFPPVDTRPNHDRFRPLRVG